MTVAGSSDLDRAVELFHALSDATRLAALDMLRDGEKCVCDLQDQLGIAQSRLSFHLRVLKDAGLVTDRKEGRWSYYTIDADALDEAHDVVVGFLPRSHEARTSPHAPSRSAGARPACCD